MTIRRPWRRNLLGQLLSPRPLPSTRFRGLLKEEEGPIQDPIPQVI